MSDEYPKQYLYRRVINAKLYIDEHYSSRIDLSGIADEACFSKFHFARIFKEICGRTPHQYLTEVRISRAKERLAAGETVARTCFSVGFDSISSFTGLFRRRVGVTPAVFQRHEIAVREDMQKRPLKFVPNCFIENMTYTK